MAAEGTANPVKRKLAFWLEYGRNQIGGRTWGVPLC
jgi:hypothetical protein